MDTHVREIAQSCIGDVQPTVDVRHLPILLPYVEQFFDSNWLRGCLLGLECDGDTRLRRVGRWNDWASTFRQRG